MSMQTNTNAQGIGLFWSVQTPANWQVHCYGPWLEAQEQMESRADTAFVFIDNLSKGNIIDVCETSSSYQVEIPGSAWQINSRIEGAYCVLLPGAQVSRQTSVKGSWAQTTEPRAWAIREHFDLAFEKVGHFAKLGKNWDTYGASRIDRDCVEKGVDVLKLLLDWRNKKRVQVPAPFVAPLPSGGIQLEWECGSKYLELILDPEHEAVEYFASDEGSEGFYEAEGVVRSQLFLHNLLIWLWEGGAKDLDQLHPEQLDQDETI